MAKTQIIGRSSPLGATVADGGVNFSLFSRTATGVEFLFFDREEDRTPSRVVRVDPITNRTYHYWHVIVPGVGPGQLYDCLVERPSAPANGMRFYPAKVLLDPHGRGVVIPKNYSRPAGERNDDKAALAMKSVVIDPEARDRYIARFAGGHRPLEVGATGEGRHVSGRGPLRGDAVHEEQRMNLPGSARAMLVSCD
jgi:glycogen operon protein